MTASKLRWVVSTRSVQDREPFNYGNFKAVAAHFITYSNLLLREGPFWLGCQFCSPIIWYPPEGYWATYELLEGEERTSFALLA